MDRVKAGLFGLCSPDFGDVFIWCEAAERLEPTGEFLGCHEVGEVDSKLIMAFVVEAFAGRFLDGAVRPLDLAVRPRVVGFSQPVLDVVRLADHVEAHLARPGGVAIARRLGELDAVVGEGRVDAIRHGFQEVFEELPGGPSISLVDALRHRKLAGAVDADEQIKLALSGLRLGDVDVEEADGIALEALALGLVALDVRQAGDAVPLKTAVAC